MIEHKIITQEIPVQCAFVCDCCGRRFTNSDIIESQESWHLESVGGFGSVFGDGAHLEVDLCQGCVKKLLGEFIRVINE